MINLITGAPGAGKTNFLIEEIEKYGEEGRPLFQHGIKGLKLPHTKIYCHNDDCKECKNPPSDALYVDNWVEWSQPHYVFIIDEVQQVWRPRGAKSLEIPEGLRGLETHRHEGIDFWFMTQHPSFLDVHARRLVTRHVHLKVTSLGRRMYDMPEACQDIYKPTVAGKLHVLNKKAFEKYESAKAHTKTKLSLPSGGKWFVLFFLVVLPLVIYFLYSRVQGARERLSTAVESTTENLQGFSSFETEEGFTFNTVNTVRNSRPVEETISPLFDLTPTVVNHPESAPAFVDLVNYSTFPRVAACVAKPSGSCNCYTQQATKLDVDESFCLEFVENRHFNPFKPGSNDSRQSPRTDNQ